MPAWANSGLIAHHLTTVSLALATMAAQLVISHIDGPLELGGVSGAEGGWAYLFLAARESRFLGRDIPPVDAFSETPGANGPVPDHPIKSQPDMLC